MKNQRTFWQKTRLLRKGLRFDELGLRSELASGSIHTGSRKAAFPAKPEVTSTCNSSSITDRIEIPTAIPRFPGSPISMDLSPTLANNVRHRKRKMAADQPEVVVTHVLEVVESKFQIVYTCFRGCLSYRHSATLPDTENIRWLLLQPEMNISDLHYDNNKQKHCLKRN